MLLLGDCLDVLPHWPDNTFDAVCTDPPYGLTSGPTKTLSKDGGAGGGFMGKTWDHGVPGVEYWREFLRVAKPGAFLTAFGGTRTYHRLVCAIEDAGWEVRDCLTWMYGCLDDKTECLTKRGWLRHECLRDDDEVMQWDHRTGQLTWCWPVEIVRYPFDGDMVVLRNRHIEQVLTPDHRVYAKVRRHSRKPKPDSYEVVTAGELHGRKTSWQVDLPLAGELAGSVAVDPERAYLVGWWLTDAWRHGGGKACMFSQAKPKTLAKLRAALASYGPSEYIKIRAPAQHNDEHTFYLTGELAGYLLTNHYDRALEWSMLDWKLAARRRLVEGLLDSDGSQQERQHGGQFWSKVQERRDIFLALCTAIGWRAYDDPDNYCVNFNRETRTTQIQAKHRPETVRYNGTVWCARVPTGAFVVRRNGRPFITGNTGFPKSLDVSKALDKAAGAEREVVGKREGILVPTGALDGWDRPWMRDEEARARRLQVTAPATELAKLYDGYGTALKPAAEFVVLARKPLVGTVAQNVERYGTGGLNIDSSRIEYTSQVDKDGATPQGKVTSSSRAGGAPDVDRQGRVEFVRPKQSGRWPPNVLLQHAADCTEEACSEECPVRQLDEQSGIKQSGRSKTRHESYAGDSVTGFLRGHSTPDNQYNDKGGASRFFPRFHYSSKASRKERAGSTHPTVKPLAVVEWLVRLTTPPASTNPRVLDPFVGSGTTLIAAKRLGIRAVGIEKEEEYVEQAYRRVTAL